MGGIGPEDARVGFYPEPRALDAAFGEITEPFASPQASKGVGDCFLRANRNELQATQVTFDRAPESHAPKHGHFSVIPTGSLLHL
jgi:hypothetical protein